MTLLDAAWIELEEEAAHAPGHGLLVRRIAPQSVCDIRAGFEQPSAHRVLLVTVPRTSLDRTAMELGSSGIEVRLYTLNAVDRDQIDVGVRLRDQRYTDLFSALGNDVVAHLILLANPREVAAALFGRLFRWQQFLKRLNPDGLDPEAQRGLYAELHFLRRHLVSALGPARAVSCWAGPQGADQDFQLGSIAVEVKSAAGHQLQELQISSERQLDDSALNYLLVYFVSLDVRPHAGETLVEAVEDARRLCDANPQALELLSSHLLEAGYLDSHRARYERTGYALRSCAYFRVTDGFPRILESDLRTGVGSVRYAISVAACEDFAIPAAQVDHLLGSVGNE